MDVVVVEVGVLGVVLPLLVVVALGALVVLGVLLELEEKGNEMEGILMGIGIGKRLFPTTFVAGLGAVVPLPLLLPAIPPILPMPLKILLPNPPLPRTLVAVAVPPPVPAGAPLPPLPPPPKISAIDTHFTFDFLNFPFSRSRLAVASCRAADLFFAAAAAAAAAAADALELALFEAAQGTAGLVLGTVTGEEIVDGRGVVEGVREGFGVLLFV